MITRCSPSPLRPARRHAAFTLIELLVVVSVITLLISILLPSLAKTKQRAQGSVCLTRIRGLITALATYTTEWDNALPLNGLIMPKSGIPIMYNPDLTPGCDPRFSLTEAKFRDQWRLEFGALWSYMGGPSLPFGYSMATANDKPIPILNKNVAKAYICPADLPDMIRTYTGTGTGATTPLWLDTSSGDPRVKQGVGAPGYFSYSVNSVLNSMGRFRDRFNAGQLPWSDPLRMINVKSPMEFITFIEEDNNSLFNDEVMDAPAYSNGDMLSNRHNGNGNVGFADGHAEPFNQIVFDHPPSAIAGTYVQHTEAMTSEYTRMFFPDRGAFAGPTP